MWGLVQMGVVQMGLVQTGVVQVQLGLVQLGLVQMGVDKSKWDGSFMMNKSKQTHHQHHKYFLFVLLMLWCWMRKVQLNDTTEMSIVLWCRLDEFENYGNGRGQQVKKLWGSTRNSHHTLDYIGLWNMIFSVASLAFGICWNSGLGPKWDQKKPNVPPKFLSLPSNAAEKRRHIAVFHCCALFRHIQCIMGVFLWENDTRSWLMKRGS